ncbi:uncharacterized protein Veg [Algoriphagus sp. 4150]|nr:hypothetical protein [Algoriphagus sp. 4150]MDR7129468.1 uncharacterized protein Veg [Algoriphagus sp. 4150]
MKKITFVYDPETEQDFKEIRKEIEAEIGQKIALELTLGVRMGDIEK